MEEIFAGSMALLVSLGARGAIMVAPDCDLAYRTGRGGWI